MNKLRLTLYCGWYQHAKGVSTFHFVVDGRTKPSEALTRAFLKEFSFPPPSVDCFDAAPVTDAFDYDKVELYSIELRKIN
jgi:hypothetical protein